MGEAKFELLRRKLEELAGAQRVLETPASQCSDPYAPHCPLINALLAESEPAAKLAAPQAA